MILSFHPCFESDVQIILGDRPLGQDEMALIQTSKAIILPQGCSAALYQACSESGALLFPNYEYRFRYPGKVGQKEFFRDFRLPHPETQTWSSVKAFKESFPGIDAFPHKLPFIIKDNNSHEADGVFFVEDRDSLSVALDHLQDRKNSSPSGFITQAFVPSEGNVLRTVIIGKRIFTYWKRPNRLGDVITTISRGGKIDHLWRTDLQEKGKALTQELTEKSGINLAALDLVFPISINDPIPQFLEINYFFARRGLGGTENFYRLLFGAICDWLEDADLDSSRVSLV